MDGFLSSARTEFWRSSRVREPLMWVSLVRPGEVFLSMCVWVSLNYFVSFVRSSFWLVGSGPFSREEDLAVRGPA